MKRHAVRLVAVAFGTALAMSTAIAPLAAAQTQSQTSKAREACTERWDEEVKGNTVPGGMTRAKYLSQCMRHFVASEKQKEEIQATDTAASDTTTTPGAQSPTTQGQ